MSPKFALSAIALAIATLGLSACNSDDPEIKTGYLIDARVQGMAYRSGDVTGTTGADGKFQYEAGKNVVFSIGGVTLPAVKGAATITPMELAGESSPSAPGALAIARFLQSLDDDGNPDNGIVASSAKLKAGAVAPGDWTEAGEAALQALLTNPADLPTEGKALQHFVKNVGAAYSLPTMKIVGRLDLNAEGNDESRAEIIAFHKASKSSFHIVAGDAKVERIDLSQLGTTALSNPVSSTNLVIASTINVGTDAGTSGFTADGVQSVAITGDLMAVAVSSTNKASNGRVAFYTLSSSGAATFHSSVEVGVLPDSLAFSPDGTKLVVANEGELVPTLDADEEVIGLTDDPLGSISVITITNGIPASTATTLDFSDFNTAGTRHGELPATLRIGRAGASVAQDIEPEYVSISSDSSKAFVTLQENNGVAVIDLSGATPSISKIHALGFKDHGLTRNAFAPSDKVPMPPTLKTYANVFGVRMPDGIATFSVGGKTYFITANEGDDRDVFLISDETARVSKLTLDATAFPNSLTLKGETELGRLTVLKTDANGAYGDTDSDGDYDKLYVLGSRSFTIFDATTGEEVFDSGSEFERTVFADALADTNASTLLNHGSINGRLDNKGPEPESVVVGTIGSNTFAFVALERSSGILMYLINDPTKPMLVQYIRNTADLDLGDISPEGLKFIPASDSPTGKPLLLVGYEVSGTVAVLQID